MSTNEIIQDRTFWDQVKHRSLSDPQCELRIERANLNLVDIRQLLVYHHQQMTQNSPAGSVNALTFDAYKNPRLTLIAAYKDNELAGIVGLYALSKQENGRSQAQSTLGEIKSMRTAPNFLRQGVASQLLNHVIELARFRGYSKILLETGSGPLFESAIRFYQAHSFQFCDRFGQYKDTEFNRFMSLTLHDN